MEKPNNLKSLINSFIYMNPYEFTLLATLIGIAISPKFDNQTQQALGNFFEQIGQTLLTIGSQNEVLHDTNTDKTIDEITSILRKNIKDIDEILNYIKNL